MKGLIKVGKTTRDPEERAEELSSSTGVPTPFFVGYQAEVNNCTRAESFVHTALKVYRLNESREFFKASMTVAINAIMDYMKIDDQYDDNSIEDDSSCDEELNLYEIEESLADDYYNGTNGQFRDYEEAMVHYKKAFELGSASACSSIGSMYRFGDGVQVDFREALRWYKEGLKRNAYGSYYNMMNVYLACEEFDNAAKCLVNICKEGNMFYTALGICGYLNNCYENKISRDEIQADVIQKELLQVKDYLNKKARTEEKYQNNYIAMIHNLDSSCEYYCLKPMDRDGKNKVNLQKELLKAYKSGHYQRCPKCRKICFEDAAVCPVCGGRLV